MKAFTQDPPRLVGFAVCESVALGIARAYPKALGYSHKNAKRGVPRGPSQVFQTLSGKRLPSSGRRRSSQLSINLLK
jgi:hypothetical protein